MAGSTRYGKGPAVWFQQMDRARPQRNRIPRPLESPVRKTRRTCASRATLAGRRHRPVERGTAFLEYWRPERNEACITTWQGRRLGLQVSGPDGLRPRARG